MPRHREIRPDEMTPFARLLFDYMRRQLPFLTFSDLAARVGVSVQAVSNWIYDGSIPKPHTLAAIADATDIPLESLYEATGIRPTPPEDQRAVQRIFDLLDRNKRSLDKTLPEADRKELDTLRSALSPSPKVTRKTPPLVDGGNGEPPAFTLSGLNGLRARAN